MKMFKRSSSKPISSPKGTIAPLDEYLMLCSNSLQEFILELSFADKFYVAIV